MPNEPVRARRFDAEDASDPIALFREWFKEAAATEPSDPDAAALATATRDGIPSVRMVLVKRVDTTGFRFFTNAESRKGCELEENPQAALCFHWKTQDRQVRVQGRVCEIPATEADAYFHSRARGSQIGAAVSAQSRPLESREMLEQARRGLDEQTVGVVPRPGYWRGYDIDPDRIEFWQHGKFRLHDRMVFLRDGGGWRKVRLYP